MNGKIFVERISNIVYRVKEGSFYTSSGIVLAFFSGMFSFENLDVYKIALQFSKTTIEETRLVPKGYFSLIDQLRRASTSIVLNIA